MASTVRNTKIVQAVTQSKTTTKQGLFERAFAFAFKGLVYAQIWEDPVVDMEALAIRSDSRIITIASGGCNVLSYLVANPAQIIAVDLNTAHVALGKLKVAAAQHLPDHAHFHRFFAEADRPENLRAYRDHVRPHLDDVSRRYWEGRDLAGRRRISGFGSGLYKRGLLGGFIGTAHLLARLYKVDLRMMLKATTLEEQRAVFEQHLAPVFDKKFIRWLTDQPPALFGLGIPPAQFEALAGDEKMADVLRKRLEKLSCDFEIRDNYFAWQAFGRGYGKGADKPLPPYLQAEHYPLICARAGRVEVEHANFVERLQASADASLDRYVLLDAQDWMNDQQLTLLWSEIFRTAAEPSLLPGRVPDALLGRWDYRAEESLGFTARDRSSIYGGVHLYVLK